MSFTIIDRYLLRETLKTWAAVMVLLVMVLFGSAFSLILRRTMRGEIDHHVLLNIVLATAATYVENLLPVALFLAILLSLGKLYQENEMTVISACGIGSMRLFRPFLALAAALALVQAWLSLELTPAANAQAARLKLQSAQSLAMSATEPGQFMVFGGGKGVYYVQSIGGDEETLTNVFIWTAQEERNRMIWAAHGLQQVDRDTGEHSLLLRDGVQYDGNPGQLDYRITHFKEMGARVAVSLGAAREAQENKPTSALFGSRNNRDAAELQRRLSMPISVVLLALLAVPLSRTAPRQGRYGKLVLGLLFYLLYTNVVSAARAWVSSGKLPPEIGAWWIHATVLLLALWLTFRGPRSSRRWWHRLLPHKEATA